MIWRYVRQRPCRFIAAALAVIGFVGLVAAPAYPATGRAGAAQAPTTIIGLGAAPVFVAKADGNLYEHIGSGWTSFAGPPSGIAKGPAVAAVSDGSRVDVFATGNDQHIYQKFWTTTAGWSGWYDFGGTGTSAPTATWSLQGNRLDLFVVGGDGRLYQMFWEPSRGWSKWFGFTAPPSGFSGPPSATDPADFSRVDVFALGTNLHLYQRYWTAAAGWTDWIDFGGNYTSPPTAKWTDDGQTLYVPVTVPDGSLYVRTWRPGSGWAFTLTFAPPPSGLRFGATITVPGNGEFASLFGVGNDNNVYEKDYYHDQPPYWMDWHSIS